MTGVAQMNVETKERIHEELDRTRRLLLQAPDENTKQRLMTYIEELEAKLLIKMSSTAR
jgi:hypothetical protein